MVMDAVRGYVQLASGLTEVTKQRAQQAAKALLQQTGADTLTTKVSDLADEIVATSKSNRQLLQAIVANEVEGAVARLGFVRSEEVAALTRRVNTLEERLTDLENAPAVTAPAATATAPTATAASPTSTSSAEPAVPEDAPPGLAVSEPDVTAPATKAAAKKAAAKKTAAKKTAVKKAAAKQTAAQKAAKKAPAKKIAKKA